MQTANVEIKLRLKCMNIYLWSLVNMDWIRVTQLIRMSVKMHGKIYIYLCLQKQLCNLMSTTHLVRFSLLLNARIQRIFIESSGV